LKTKHMKNWIDKTLEESFKEFEKRKEVENDVVMFNVIKKNDSFKSFKLKSIYDILIKRFNLGNL
jgi:hypothetical protein